MATSYGDDEDQGHRNWLSDIAEAKHACRELLEMSERMFQDPERCLDIGLSQPATELLRHQHAATLNYYDEIEPFHSQLVGGQWERELCAVDVPHQESRVELEERIPHTDSIESYIGPPVFYRGDRHEETIALGKLDGWEMRTATVAVDAIKQFEGRVQQTVTKRVWLPPRACRRVYRTLNSCVEDLGFAAEVSELEVDVDPYKPHQ